MCWPRPGAAAAGRRRTDPVDPVLFCDIRSDVGPAVTTVDSIEVQSAVDLIGRLLSAAQAEVLIQRTVADLSAGEVGELMGRPESWVRVTQQ